MFCTCIICPFGNWNFQHSSLLCGQGGELGCFNTITGLPVKTLEGLFSRGTDSCLVQKLIHELLVWIGCDFRGTLLLCFQMEITPVIFLTWYISILSWVLNCSFSLPDSGKCSFFLTSSSVPDLNMTQLHFRNSKQHFLGGVWGFYCCCLLVFTLMVECFLPCGWF